MIGVESCGSCSRWEARSIPVAPRYYVDIRYRPEPKHTLAHLDSVGIRDILMAIDSLRKIFVWNVTMFHDSARLRKFPNREEDVHIIILIAGDPNFGF